MKSTTAASFVGSIKHNVLQCNFLKGVLEAGWSAFLSSSRTKAVICQNLPLIRSLDSLGTVLNMRTSKTAFA